MMTLDASGSYFPDLDYSTRPSLHLTTTNACPPHFLPPISPSAKLSLSQSHSSSLQSSFNGDFVSRKRARRDDHASDSCLATPQQTTAPNRVRASSAWSSEICSPGAESPAAFVSTRYALAGGLDTPSAARLDKEEQRESELRELDYRPNRISRPARHYSAGYFPQTPALAKGNELTGRKRPRASDQQGWGRVVVNLVGGVAGKVFNFCWNGAFRGFQAGGGQGYRMDSRTPPVVEQKAWMNLGDKDDVFNKHYEADKPVTQVPGQFPESGFIHDYMSHPHAYRAEELSTPMAYGEEVRNPLRESWVFVSNREGVVERDHSLLYPSPSNARANNVNQRQPNSRTLLNSGGNRPRLVRSRPSMASSPGASLNRPASFASPRASPSRSRATAANSFFPDEAEHCRPRSLMSSPRRARDAEARRSFDAPNSPDVQRFAKKIRRKERKEDESIQRVNRQLQGMIKEGKEALGTTIEIEDDEDEDEGFGEGTEVMAASKW